MRLHSSDIITHSFNPLPTGEFFVPVCRLMIIFKINFSKEIFPLYHQSVKQIWIQIRHFVRPDLYQIVCQGYQQRALVGEELPTIIYPEVTLSS